MDDKKRKRMWVGVVFLVAAVVIGVTIPQAGPVIGLVLAVLAITCIISSFLE